jgi:hypothetical protein
MKRKKHKMFRVCYKDNVYNYKDCEQAENDHFHLPLFIHDFMRLLFKAIR